MTIPNTNEIKLYFHCSLCLDELPEGVSPMNYQRIQVGFTPLGLQVWCVRHDANIAHIDFEGRIHPANTERVKTAHDEIRDLLSGRDNET